MATVSWHRLVVAAGVALFLAAPAYASKPVEPPGKAVPKTHGKRPRDVAPEVPQLVVEGDAVRTVGSFTPVCPDRSTSGTGSNIVDIVNLYNGTDTSARILLPAPERDPVTFSVATPDVSAVSLGYGSTDQLVSVFATVPAGSTRSSSFVIRGHKVSGPSLRIARTDGKAAPFDWSVNVWELEPLVDFDDLGGTNLCASPEDRWGPLDPVRAVDCGAEGFKAVAADGAAQLLLRIQAGVQGEACMRVVPDAGLDTGNMPDGGDSLPNAPGHQHPYRVFGVYQAPDAFGLANEAERTVEIEVAYLPGSSPQVRAQQVAVRRAVTVRRPPVMLVHGLWSDAGMWGGAFKAGAPGAIVVNYDYARSAHQSVGLNARGIYDFYDEITISKRLRYEWAASLSFRKFDVIAHSMGGLVVTRALADTHWVHRLATLGTPHFGSRIANMLINLRASFPAEELIPDYEEYARNPYALEVPMRDPMRGLILRLRRSIDGGAICDLAENSRALAALPSTEVPMRVYSSSGGPIGELYWPLAFAAVPFLEEEQAEHVAPYLFHEPNDALVSATSQWAGLAGSDYPDLVHFSLPWLLSGFGLPGIAGSDAVATDVLAALVAEADGVFANAPAYASSGLGELNDEGAGRGVSIDQGNYATMCGVGGVLNP